MITFDKEPPEVEQIIRELTRPENRDLMIEVVNLGTGSEVESFMVGFTQSEVCSFDEYADSMHLIDASLIEALGLEPDYRSMSERYDQYLASMEDLNDKVSLNDAQTQRFNAIVDRFDDGWSGAYYAVLMRHIQRLLAQIINN